MEFSKISVCWTFWDIKTKKQKLNANFHFWALTGKIVATCDTIVYVLIVLHYFNIPVRISHYFRQNKIKNIEFK